MKRWMLLRWGVPNLCSRFGRNNEGTRGIDKESFVRESTTTTQCSPILVVIIHEHPTCKICWLCRHRPMHIDGRQYACVMMFLLASVEARHWFHHARVRKPCPCTAPNWHTPIYNSSSKEAGCHCQQISNHKKRWERNWRQWLKDEQEDWEHYREHDFISLHRL